MGKYNSVKNRPNIKEDSVEYNGKRVSHKKVKNGDQEIDIYNGFQNPEAYEDYEYNGRVYKVRKDVRPGLERLIAGAKADGIDLPMTSSFRNYDKQVSVAREAQGSGAAAKPGNSRHGFGDAFDFSDPRHPANHKNTTRNYHITPTYAWLADNAHKYGFVAPVEMYGGDAPEPWHYEYYAEYDPANTVEVPNPFKKPRPLPPVESLPLTQRWAPRPAVIHKSAIVPRRIDYGKTLAGGLASVKPIDIALQNILNREGQI